MQQAAKPPVVIKQVMSPTHVVCNHIGEHRFSIHFHSDDGPWSSLTNVVDREIRIPSITEIQEIATKHMEAFKVPEFSRFMQDKKLEIVKEIVEEKPVVIQLALQESNSATISLLKQSNQESNSAAISVLKQSKDQIDWPNSSEESKKEVTNPVMISLLKQSKDQIDWPDCSVNLQKDPVVKQIDCSVTPDKPKEVAKKEQVVATKTTKQAEEVKSSRKTSMCKFGKDCARRQCDFAHSIRELKLQEVHPQFKQTKCTTDNCSYGVRCNYWHGENERAYQHCEYCTLLSVDGTTVAKICRVPFGEKRPCSLIMFDSFQKTFF